MKTTRLLRPTLVAGHAAVAVLALAAFHVALPALPQPQWHAVGRPAQLISQAPRRLPASRRAERIFTD